MALLTLTSTLVGWYNLRFISQVEKDNTQALIPTMNMARQLSEASAWELFAAQNLTSADNEKMWQAQGRMLTAQSLKINALLQALREQGFDTTAIEHRSRRSPVHYVSKGNWWGGVCNYASNNGNSVSR